MREVFLLVALLLWGSVAPAQAKDVPQAQLGPWVGVGFGLSTSDSVELEDGSQGSFAEDSSTVATVSVEAFYTTLRFDFGGVMRHMAGGEYQRPNGVAGQFGSMFLVGPLLRWRYWNVEPGSFYVQYVPAWTVTMHSDYLRRDAAMMHSIDREDVAEVTHALSNNMAAGFLLMLRPDLALDLKVNTMVLEGDLDLDATADHERCNGSRCAEYERTRTGIHLSLCWSL